MDTSPGFDPARDIALDPRSLRGLAHPLRVRLLGELRLRGAATASQLAQRLGQSSGATSYHLRQLAAHGFVAEVADLGTTRERYWRAAHRSTHFDLSPDPADRAVGAEYLRAVGRAYADRILRYTDAVETVPDDLGPEWARVFDLSDWRLDLTAEEAGRLGTELHELALRYRRDEAAPDSRPIVLQVQLMPVPDATS